MLLLGCHRFLPSISKRMLLNHSPWPDHGVVFVCCHRSESVLFGFSFLNQKGSMQMGYLTGLTLEGSTGSAGFMKWLKKLAMACLNLQKIHIFLVSLMKDQFCFLNYLNWFKLNP